jgi:hypothetical protein
MGKRIRGGVVAFILSTAILVFYCTYAGAAVQVSVPEEIVAAPGTTFQVPVSIGSVSGVLGYNFELVYSSHFEYVGVQNGVLTASWPLPVVNAAVGQCSVASYGVIPVSGPGVMLVLTLRVLPSTPIGTVGSISLRKAELNDGAIAVTTRSGTVTVARIAFLMLPPQITVQPESEFIVPVELSEAEGVLGYLFELTYDAEIFQLQEHLPGPPVPGWGVPMVNAQEPGRILVAGWGIQPLPDTTTLLELRFKTFFGIPLGTETRIDFQTAELNDGDIPIVTEGALVKILDENPMPLNWSAAALAALLILAATGKARLAVVYYTRNHLRN